MQAGTRDGNAPLPRSVDGRSAGAVARACASAAGEIIRPAFSTSQTLSVKGRGNVVTENDVLVERTVADMLWHAFPDHGLLAEEDHADTPAEGYVWVVDPIDGTRNFASGIPFF